MAQDGVCPRCGCDFSLARQAMEQAGRRLEEALRAVAVGDRELARSCLGDSLAMHRQPLARAIKDFLDADACCMENGYIGQQAPLLPADAHIAGKPADVRQDECWNPDALVLRM